jgi:hypothetical protein
VYHPVSLSTAELDVLAQDDLMKLEMDRDPPLTKLTGEGLEASVVHLHDASERDLLVVGSGAPFLGANVGPFWVIRDLPDGPRVILHAIALGIGIRKAKSHGLKNIDTFAATAAMAFTTHYRFDGTQYRQTEGKEEQSK